MITENKYDYIIAGMGCSGLSLAVQLQQSSLIFTKILLVDKDLKTKNDRTWCFWTKEKTNWFDEIIFKRWHRFVFESTDFKKEYVIDPYYYCMIKGIDFYSYCMNKLQNDPRFVFVTEDILDISTSEKKAHLTTSASAYTCDYLFNSAFRRLKKKSKDVNYTQHFMGWVIETEEDVFDETLPVFMNFNTDQYNDCRFFYVLPHSKKRALIEYTGFSQKKIEEDAYVFELKRYIEETLKIKSYTLLENETGEIPMTESVFINPFGNRVINIGTAGGSSKPSTGYTFYFIQKNTKQIVRWLENGSKDALDLKQKKRFSLYDKILLDVLNKKEIPAQEVFSILFQKNNISSLLSFLNEESSFAEDLAIINSVPKKPFIRSALRKLF
jgi:lycopene beta-cyclase